MPKKKKPAASWQLPATRLTWLPKKTFELQITIPKTEVKKAYKKALDKLAKTVSIKGFRKGKAPTNLVEKELSQERIYQEAAQILLPQAYAQALSQHKLRPIIAPKITPVKMTVGKDWTIKAKSAEAPDVKLGNWQKAVKEAKKESPKIWVPDHRSPDKNRGEGPTPDKPNKPNDPNKPNSNTQKINKILQALLKEATVEISDFVIEDETNRMLAKLLDQINKLGLTLDQYLQANNKTQEGLRKEYRETAERSLKLEFILLKLAQEKKIKVKDEEIEKMIKAVPDEKVRKSFETPAQKAYIATLIRKQKTLDMLLKLV